MASLELYSCKLKSIMTIVPIEVMSMLVTEIKTIRSKVKAIIKIMHR